MTEQELREKIKKIVAPYVSGWGEDEAIASDLIAAGLTFDKTMAVLAERANSKTLIQKAQYYDQMKHRAEVAETALSKVFTKTFPWCCAKVREDIVDECLQEAEKELQEEMKDE